MFRIGNSVNLVLSDLLTYWAIFKLSTMLVKKLNASNLIISFQYYVFLTGLILFKFELLFVNTGFTCFWKHLEEASFLQSKFFFLLGLQMRDKQ